MSRTTLCIFTAACLATVSFAVMAGRYMVLGPEVKVPAGPGAWKIQLLVHGKATAPDAKLLTATPLDFGRQHVVREACRSNNFLHKQPDLRHPERRQVHWTYRSGTAPGPFRASYDFWCMVDTKHPTAPMIQQAENLYEPPGAGEHLDLETGGDRVSLITLASHQTVGHPRTADQALALYTFVDRKIGNEPRVGGPAPTAAECLRDGRGDSGAKSRLLSSLLRSRGIPARLVTGLTLSKGPEQLAHTWVEAWFDDRWVPMCPFHHHYGRVPSTYLVFGFGDLAMARGRHVRDLDYAFLVERATSDGRGDAAPSAARRFFLAISFYRLPPAEQRFVEFLLLVPFAALMVCVYRNVIGLFSFGTFAPALLGLTFRELHSMPGLAVFVAIVLAGWLLRRVLNRFHLLQVPRTAVLLSLVVLMVIVATVAANHHNPPLAATQYVSLFPIVILTGMIERFWTLETEDSTASSFRTLVGTVVMAASIALVLSLRGVVNHLFRYPETLGLIMAAQFLLGRYTGYKLSELFRFRHLANEQPAVLSFQTAMRDNRLRLPHVEGTASSSPRLGA